ncbi:hypothetical protein LJE86_06425 [bacterium BMS3Abin03]|nr:hypothetical protein [bacterium BMS3Abin03]
MKDEINNFTTKFLPLSETEYNSFNLPFNFKFGHDKESKATILTYHLFDDVVCEKIE